MKTAIVLLVLAALIVLAIVGRIKDGTWVQKFLLGLDIYVCTLVWHDYDITISARCGLYLRQASGPFFWRLLGKLLNALSKGHCEFAIAHDLARAKSAESLLTTYVPPQRYNLKRS